jgi:hypothetical protein
MKKCLYRIAVILVLATVLGSIIMSTGCSKTSTASTTGQTTKTTTPAQNEGFAIYLTKDNISPFQLPALDQIKVAVTPLIALSDVINYSASTYDLTLSTDAANRISNLIVPTDGKSFVVCVNRKPVYWGVFWAEYSSAIPPASRVIVSFPLSHTVQTDNAESIQTDPNILELYYSGADDPRNNTVIIDSLRQAGKLINEGFAIYLTKGDIPPAQMEALSHVDIPDKPVIGPGDIITYNSTNHAITLTTDAYNRVTDLRPGVYGESFVVCVNRSPIYWGAFWTPISSVSFSGIAIEIPFNPALANTIAISLGYPSQSFFKGDDPRNNKTIMASLKQSGKLITTPDNPLPHSFKGYELYSWQQDNQWNFTLMSGTDRNKTIQEIISGNNTVTADGWVNIHVVGLNALKALIWRIPLDEYVTWWLGPSSAEFNVTFAFPPADDVNAIKSLAAQCGLFLSIVLP